MSALDTETTDKNPEQALVASICLARITPTERRVEVLSDLVAVDMPEEASAVNGLTTERLRAEGKPAADVLDMHCEQVAMTLTAEIPLIAMNAVYDLTVLDRDCRRNGVPTLDVRLDGRPIAPVVDPMVLDKKVVKYRRRVSEEQGARCLKTLAQVHGVGWDDELAHSAQYDAVQAARVVWQLMSRFPQLARMTLAELHDAQVDWYADQSADLAAFWRKKAAQVEHEASVTGDPGERDVLLADVEELRARADGVSTEWPVRSLPDAGVTR